MKVVVMLTKTFFNDHPLAGNPTNFASLVKSGKKIHTCRDNYEYWEKKIVALKNVGGSLSVRQWSGKPYRSPQEVIVEIPSTDVGISELTLEHTSYRYEGKEIHEFRALVDNIPISLEELAKNDGFSSVGDFTAFLLPLFCKYRKRVLRFAIVHFNKFTY